MEVSALPIPAQSRMWTGLSGPQQADARQRSCKDALEMQRLRAGAASMQTQGETLSLTPDSSC